MYKQKFFGTPDSSSEFQYRIEEMAKGYSEKVTKGIVDEDDAMFILSSCQTGPTEDNKVPVNSILLMNCSGKHITSTIMEFIKHIMETERPLFLLLLSEINKLVDKELRKEVDDLFMHYGLKKDDDLKLSTEDILEVLGTMFVE